MQNLRFASYYKAQNIVPEEEWETFVDCLKRPLPTVFRVGGSRVTAHSLNAIIKDTYVPMLSNATFEGEPVTPPEQLPWFKQGFAWQFNVPKKTLRKSMEFRNFHSWLVFETEVGNISRQEAVSMLPPLFLDVEPHHIVMDMCAAPGSKVIDISLKASYSFLKHFTKTAQIIESLHAPSSSSTVSQSIPTGLVIANDSDHKRTHLLIHQSARLPSPCLMVTNLDASIYPIIKFPVESLGDEAGKEGVRQLLFDRILCDVPCSGDGTLRKNVGIWKSWGVGDGNGLHSLQLRILQRAMRMLKDDGRIVYSTCSLNPVENEAVITAALKTNQDFELVDISDRLPELKRSPGLTHWKPTFDRNVETFPETFDAYAAALPEGAEKKMTEYHWPPSKEEAEALAITRCIRILPHLQDTGGFFVAVLQKKVQKETTYTISSKREMEESTNTDVPDSKRLKFDGEKEDAKNAQNYMSIDTLNELGVNPVPELSQATGGPGQTRLLKGRSKKNKTTEREFKENPYTFLASDDPVLRTCMERLNLSLEFPSANVLVRNPAGEPARSMYITNDIVKKIVLNNDYERLRLTSCGTKVFAKQEAGKGTEAQFRILGEGLSVVLPFTDPKSIMVSDIAALKIFVGSYYPLCSSFEGAFREALEARPGGSHLVRIPAGRMGETVLTYDLVLPIWKSNVSATLMIDKKAKSALSLRLFGRDITTAGKGTRKGDTQEPDEVPIVEIGEMLKDTPGRCLESVTQTLILMLRRDVNATSNDPIFQALPQSVRHRIDKAFDDTVSRVDVDDRKSQRQDYGVDSGAGFLIEGNVDRLNKSSTTISNAHIPLSLVARTLELAGLQPDEQVLSVFRNAASGWSGTDEKTGGEDSLFVSRADWQSVCAVLLENEPGDEVDNIGYATEDEDREGSDDYVEVEESDEDVGEDSEYEDPFQKPTRANRGKGRTVEKGDSEPLTPRQLKECRRSFALFFPDAPNDEGLESRKIMIKDITKVSNLLKEKLKLEEIVEMVEAFSSSPDKSMSFEDFQKMMVAAKLV